MRSVTDDQWRRLADVRAGEPHSLAQMAGSRRRRPLVAGDGRLLVVAADHPARRILGVGGDPMAMADRRQLLGRLVTALRRPGVDGVLATPDIIEDLLILGELDDKVVFGSMNRGGLTESIWELDDRFTAYDARTIKAMGLEGGKMLLRLDLADSGTNVTLGACASAVTELAAHGLAAMVEPLPAFRDADGHVRISSDPRALIEAIAVASALGPTSAHTWLKLPAPADPEAVLAATTLPTLLLGGDPGSAGDALLDSWRRAMSVPVVKGLVAGRSLLYPRDDDVARWVDAAAEIVHGSVE